MEESNMKSVMAVLLAMLLLVGGIATIFGLESLLIWWIWNTLAAGVFNAPVLGWWAAVALTLAINMIIYFIKGIIRACRS